MVKGKLYVITWRDHFSSEGWFELDSLKIHDNLCLTSTGFFMKSDKNYYHFARTVGDSVCADMMSILKKQIVDLYEVDFIEK